MSEPPMTPAEWHNKETDDVIDSVVGECDEEECELINKAQKFINKPIF